MRIGAQRARVGRALGLLPALVLALSAPASAREAPGAPHVLGRDARGRALGCVAAPSVALAPASIVGLRGWETIPGIVRSDGSESFRIEVTLAAPVDRVELVDVAPCVEALASGADELSDDGHGEDRVARDLVYTSVAFRYRAACSLPPHYGFDPASPSGLDVLSLGTVRIDETDGTVTEFVAPPAIGVLDAGRVAVEALALGDDLVVAPHLVNVRTDLRATQDFLRTQADGLRAVTTRVYDALPDAFDFLTLFSADHFERVPRGEPRNFVVGSHRTVKVDFSGTGQVPFDATNLYGSRGRLLGLNVIDAFDRGLFARIATHELLHQWVAYIDPSLGLTAPDHVHYDPRSSAGSLVGGFRWTDDGQGNLVLDCMEGAAGAHHVAPLDAYMMGLIDGAGVPPLYVYSDTGLPPVFRCGEAIDDVVRTITIDDIQAVHGRRTPGPDGAQRSFALAFLVESHDRLLTPTELTFYDLLAAHYTRPVPPGDPDPYLGVGGWQPMTRFFGAGTTWRSDVRVCGNGVREVAEECDDGNTTAGDGCSPRCEREVSDLPREVTAVLLDAFNPHAQRSIPVALLTTPRFAATTVDASSVRLGTGAAAPVAAVERDVDGDGDVDMLLTFHARALRCRCGDATAPITGRTSDGRRFTGSLTLDLRGCR